MSSKTETNQKIAFTQLIAHIDNLHNSNFNYVYNMAEQCKLYTTRHSTRLKQQLMAHYPSLEEFKSGKQMLLSFKDHVTYAVSLASEKNFDDNENDTVILSKAAGIIRREMFNAEQKPFCGFSEGCQKNSVSQVLLEFLSTIQYGANNVNINEQSTLSIAQLIKFNSYVRTRKD